MLISKKDVLITSVTLTKSKKTEKPYLLVNFLDTEDGSSYSIMEENLEVMQSVHGMEKWKVNIVIKGTKYGTQLQIRDYLEKVGQV